MAFCLAGCSASAQSPSIDGSWLSGDGERVVEVGPCGPGATMRCGTIIWLQSPTDSDGIPVKDIANADPALRRRSICNLEVLTGLSPADQGSWGGQVYDPDAGRTRRGELKLRSDTLRLNFAEETPDTQAARDQVWTRMPRPFARCSPR